MKLDGTYLYGLIHGRLPPVSKSELSRGEAALLLRDAFPGDRFATVDNFTNKGFVRVGAHDQALVFVQVLYSHDGAWWLFAFVKADYLRAIA